MVKRKVLFLVVLCALPILVYPIFFLVSIVADVFFGDQVLIYQLLYGSHHELLVTALIDWASSLPISFVITILVLAPLRTLLIRFGAIGIGILFVIAAFAGGLLAYLSVGPGLWDALIVVTTGVILTGLLHLSLGLAQNIRQEGD